jgi:signal transduction histidine kinase
LPGFIFVLHAAYRLGCLPLSGIISHMSDQLQQPLYDIYGACEVLLRQEYGPLTPKQRQRITEIIRSAQDVRNRINHFDIAQAIPEIRGEADPRVTLLYATRTPLTMVEMATRLLIVAHLKRTEPLTPNQYDLVQSIADFARQIIYETERLWEEMKRDELGAMYDFV